MGLAAGLMAGATALQTVMQVGQATSAYGAAKNEAEQEKQLAAQERMKASGQIISSDWQAQQALSRGASQAGASGFDPTTGSPKAVATQTVEDQRITDMYIRYSGKLASSKDLYAADVAKYEGKQALTQGLFGAATTALTGGAQSWKLSKYGSVGSSTMGSA